MGKIIVADTLKLGLVVSYIPIASVLHFLYFSVQKLYGLSSAIDVVTKHLHLHLDLKNALKNAAYNLLNFELMLRSTFYFINRCYVAFCLHFFSSD